MIEIVLLIIGLAVGVALGYYLGKSKAYQSADIGSQSALLTGLNTQIAEMKGKFSEIEKSRIKLEEEREKRMKDLLDLTKKNDEEKDKRIKEMMESNQKFLVEQGKSRAELEKQRDAQILDMKRLVTTVTQALTSTQKRGAAGESILTEVLHNSIKAGVVKKNLKVGSQVVEFGWVLGDGKHIPIDSKLPEVFALVDSYDLSEDVDEKREIAKKLKDKIIKEIASVQKYQNQPNTIDMCILVTPPAVLDIAPDLVCAGQEKNVFVCSYKDVFPIAHILQEQYIRFKEEGDVGEYKKMVKSLFSILDTVLARSDTIDRAIKQLSNANGDIKDEVAKGKRLNGNIGGSNGEQ